VSTLVEVENKMFYLFYFYTLGRKKFGTNGVAYFTKIQSTI
jgi:hypothetical protein